ncbi:HTH-type transcriptional regulatory protein GabR [wastewater metagenome]|uniref:HTH-type transcriptional regulatory protein GabR n=3 Tax=root TaxID=1 RepID=A0A5B8R687_9ZZZZ|nr:PLP-dependent aminotransferase family protein [Arhodomonas aquaeolei]MCS4504922.1 PLP-dependent aminotransferase family protein [Arhodomonas aquaeolei]QEA04126.1 HTH-type transcriptional regulatory protein GabR [uncultured organism]
MLLSDLLLQYMQQRTEWTRLPVRRRVYAALRQAILEERLAPGAKLPATRTLARELGLARNTVMRAYEQLEAEGYVRGHTGAGTFVTDTLPRDAPSVPAPPRREAGHAPGLSRRGADIAAHPASSTLQSGAFVPGIPDVAAFPFRVWRRLLGRYMNSDHSRLMQYASGGYGPLKAVLAEHLKVSRMISCDPRQILIVGGAHQGLDLCARMLADPGDEAWMEDPGYWGARNVLRAAGLRLRAIPVDADGIAPQPSDWRRPPRLIFTSPSYQLPTGAVLSLGRRRLLLEQASAADAWIIEDDYDNELRYNREPIASLYGLSSTNRVIYVGTFSKVMYPGLRLAYLVVPPELVEPLSTANAELFREGRLVEQAALAEFIESGRFSAHIRRMRQIYAERQEALRTSLETRLGDAVSVSGGQGGIHLTYHFREALDDERVSRDALSEGIVARPLSLYYHDTAAARPGLVLGYATVTPQRIADASAALARVVERRLDAKGR